MTTTHELECAYRYASIHGVILVIAAGNYGRIGYDPLISNNFVIPVAACDEFGKYYELSNLSMTIGRNGFMAPGVKIKS